MYHVHFEYDYTTNCGMYTTPPPKCPKYVFGQGWHAHLVTTRDGTCGNYHIPHKIIYCTFENVGFRTNFGVQGKERLSWHVPNLKELNCKICPSSFLLSFIQEYIF